LSYHCCPVNLKNVVIPECLCRESSGFAALKATGFPTQELLRAPALRLIGRASTFKIFAEDFIGDDKIVVCYF